MEDLAGKGHGGERGDSLAQWCLFTAGGLVTAGHSWFSTLLFWIILDDFWVSQYNHIQTMRAVIDLMIDCLSIGLT